MSTRVLSIAGLTIEKVGHTEPVSYTGHTPSGSTLFPSLSKQAVTIRYVPSLASSARREEPAAEAPPRDSPGEKNAPPAPFRCSCTWSTALPLQNARVTNAHSVTPSSSHVSGTAICAS